MSWETAAYAASSMISASAESKQPRNDAKAIVAEGTIKAQNEALATRARAANLSVSFLNSGLTMEGTPASVVNAAYESGLRDTNRIIDNTNTAAKNTIKAARDKALSGLVSKTLGTSLKGFNFGDTLDDVGAGVNTAISGDGFGTGYDISKTIRENRSIF